MNTNINKNTVDITLPIPCISYELSIERRETKEPTKIIILLLEIISNLDDVEAGFANELCALGISDSLHSLFAKELAKLCNEDMLIYHEKNIFRSGNFPQCKVKDFAFTEKGKHLYEKGFILTGDVIESKPTNIYNVVTMENVGNVMTEKSKLYQEYSYEPLCDNNFDYEKIFNETKKEFKVKGSEEFIRGSIKKQDNTQYNVKDCITLDLSKDDLEIKFSDERYMQFARDNITVTEFNNYLNTLEMFEYEEHVLNAINLRDYGEIDNVYPISSLDALMGTEALITLNAEQSREIMNWPLMQDVDFTIRFDKNKKMILVLPVEKYYSNYLLREENEDTIARKKLKIKTACEVELSEANKENIFNIVEKHYIEQEPTEENDLVIKALCLYCGNTDTFEKYLWVLLNDNINENDIVKLKKSFPDSEWNNVYTDNIKEYIVQKLDDVYSVDNVGAAYHALQRLRKSINMIDSDYLESLISCVEDIVLRYPSELEHLFSIFEQYYSPDKILKYEEMNVVKIYMGQIVEFDPIKKSYENTLIELYVDLQDTFEEICNMLGIDSYKKYVIDDEYDVDSFMKHFETLELQQKMIEKYKKFAEDEYSEFAKYIKIFAMIYEKHKLEKSIELDPSKITKDYILSLIRKADYRNSLIDMTKVLELKLNNGGKELSGMIDKALASSAISEEQANKFHELRKRRNDYVHSNKRNHKKITKEEVISYCDEVFDYVSG